MSSLFASREGALALRAGAGIALAAAAALLIHQGLQLTWALLGPSAPTDASGGSEPVRTFQTAVPNARIGAWHLFGSQPAAIDLAALAASAPETDLALQLRGVWADLDGQGVAFIAAEETGESAYRVGDEVSPGVSLKAVRADHVMLDRGGRIESLRLSDQAAPAGNTAARQSPAQRGPAAGNRPAPPASAALFVPPAGSNAPGGSWSALQGGAVDPAEIARNVSVLPVMEGGKLIGVRVSGGRDAALMSRFGLQPTDIVTAVNGQPLTDISRGREMIDQLRDSREVTVSVRRDGKMQDIKVRLQ
jgi:general secretion pathway protein C